MPPTRRASSGSRSPSMVTSPSTGSFCLLPRASGSGDITGDWGLRVQWEIRRGGQVIATHMDLVDVIRGWEHVTHGYIDVGEHLTIRGKKYASLSPAAEFGYILEHKVANDELKSTLELAPGNPSVAKLSTKNHVVHGLRVPVGGKVTLRHRLETRPAGTADGKGCLGLLLPFLQRFKKS